VLQVNPQYEGPLGKNDPASQVGGLSVNSEDTAPFETIESAQEYLGLLGQVLLETHEAIEAEIRAQAVSASPRRLDALKLIVYNLEKLSVHMKRSHLILNDLRTLRRLVHQERPQIAV
jgi:hypothetical protein